MRQCGAKILPYGRLSQEFNPYGGAFCSCSGEVPDLLKVDENTVYRLATIKRLLDFKVASSWRFKHSDIDSWVEHQKEAAVHASEDNKLGRREP